MKAVQGLLDLRGWDWSAYPTLSLNGEWEFYPNELIEPGAVPVSIARFVSLPSDWKGLLGPENDSVLGSGSYRLRMLIEAAPDAEYSLRLPAIPASSALYVNGRLLARSGQPAEREDEYTPYKVPYSASLTPGVDTFDIVIHAANFDEPAMSGITQPVKFGTEAAMNKAYAISVGSQLTVSLVLLLHAVYAMALYLIGSRQKGLISFVLSNIFAIVLIAVDDDRLLAVWFGISHEWTWKLLYLSFMGGAVFMLQFCKHLLPSFRIWQYARWYSGVCVLASAIVLFTPVKVFSYWDFLHTFVTVVPFLVVPVLAVIAIRRGESDMIYILLGITAIAINMVWGIVKNAGLIESGFYPFDMIAAYMCFALFWLKHYFRTASRTAKLAKQLQAADKLKDEFLVHTSHELRNPLHSILNIAQTVLDSGGRSNDEQNRARLSLLLSVGRRMSFMLTDLTDHARYKQNRIPLRPVALHLQTVAAGTIDMIQFMTEGKPIRLRNEVPESLPSVLADENRLIQILFNLLHNAVKYTNEGEIAIRASVRHGKVHVTVRDTGIGMNEEQLSRVFEPYERGAADADGGADGIGLGLAISKQLVELHGGQLTAVSKPGRGSEFAFALPAADASSSVPQGNRQSPQLSGEKAQLSVATPEAETNAPPEDRVDSKFSAGETAAGQSLVYSGEMHTGGDKPRLLAVDDDPVNLRVLRDMLRDEGYEIRTVTSGHGALAMLEDGPWDLLIADVMMPGMSGYELARKVRGRFSRSELPILLLTARSRTEDIEVGFRAGANDYLSKPVESTVLKARVRALTEVTLAAREQARMKAAWLQAQVEPHFLFNTLNSISALSEIDLDRMRELMAAFSDYLRTGFDFRNLEPLMPLKEELELIETYLFIERERFENRIKVVWEGDRSLSLRIPPLSVQPLVENAVQHGILQRASGGIVTIAVKDLGNTVEIAVADDGVGMDADTINKALLGVTEAGRRRGVGLYNINHRLRQMYGEGLRIKSVPGQGTIVSFVVPKHR